MNRIKSRQPRQDCPDSNELVEYFRHSLPEARMAAIESHFADCQECLENTPTVFETLVDLDSWSARTHGEAIRREALLSGLQRAGKQQSKGSAWIERLRRWHAHVAGVSAGAVELVVTASGARIVARTLGDFVAPGGMQFEPTAAVRGSEAPGPARGSDEVLAVGNPSCRIHVDEQGKTQLSLERWPADCLNPAVLVVDLHGGEPPLLVEMTERAGGRMVGEFRPPAGEYMVLFAPAEKKQQ
jgi:hypothetical protein